MSLIGLLVFVVIIAIVFYIITQMPLPGPWRNIALCIVGLIVILYLLGALTGAGPAFIHLR
jgi:hypothetical protein